MVKDLKEKAGIPDHAIYVIKNNVRGAHTEVPVLLSFVADDLLVETASQLSKESGPKQTE